MKKFILFTIAVIITTVTFSQVRTLTAKTLKAEQVYWAYTYDDDLDSLTANQDTIQQVIRVNKDFPYSIYVRSTFDTIAGADTIVYCNVYGKLLSNNSYTSMIADSSAAVGGATTKEVYNYTNTIWTMTADTTSLSVDSTNYYSYAVARTTPAADNYGYIMLEWIIGGDDSTGTGVWLTGFEIYFIRKE